VGREMERQREGGERVCEKVFRTVGGMDAIGFYLLLYPFSLSTLSFSPSYLD